jgi:hypothetical protein
MSQSDFWTPVRAELTRGHVAEGAVVLPSENHLGWEGALVVGETRTREWTIATVDYGRPRILFTRSSAAEIITALYGYVLSPLPPAQSLTTDQQDELQSATTADLSDLAARVREGTDLVVDVPAGVLLDRVGALDGYRLYPSGTSIEARSLPPTVLTQPLHTFVTTGDVRMRVGTTPPWFGRPGGGLRFEIENQAVGLRDLVRDGRLSVVAGSPA